jgi:hypothetical protein
VLVPALLSLPHAARKSAAVLPSATTRWFFMDDPLRFARDAGRCVTEPRRATAR